MIALEQKEQADKEEDDSNWLVNKVILALSQAKEKENELMSQYEHKLAQKQALQEYVSSSTKKLKVCKTCNRLFANAEHLKRHEMHSELHHKNLTVSAKKTHD